MLTQSRGLVRKLHQVESTVAATGAAEELIINVNGGHINTIEEGKRSFEAMTAVVYRPEALVSNDKGTRNTLTSIVAWLPCSLDPAI